MNRPATVFEPAALGPLTLRNRVIKAATFEGVSIGGQVTDDLIAFHRRVAAGGVGMTTVAYCAVSPGGRVMPDCLVLDAATVAPLSRLTEAVHAEGAAVSAQIGHAGLVAEAKANGVPTLAPSRRFSPLAKGLVRGASEADMREVVDAYTTATRNAIAAGFDAVEIHMGHNYLLSSFLSPNLNRRRDGYGGSIENRARFPRRVLSAVREASDGKVAVVAKLNMVDGVAAGLWVQESLAVAAAIEADGSVDALVLTGGSSLLARMFFFRGEAPIREFAETQSGMTALAIRVFGKKLFPEMPFEEAFLLPYAQQFREALKLPLVLIGGINRLDTMQHAMSEGFEFVAMGRALLREPDLIARLQRGEAEEGICLHCNKCAATIYTGTHCVLAPQDRPRGPREVATAG